MGEASMAADDKEHELERRIRERAYKIWEDEGRPEGRHEEHWNLAKLAIAERDALPTMRSKVPPAGGE